MQQLQRRRRGTSSPAVALHRPARARQFTDEELVRYSADETQRKQDGKDDALAHLSQRLIQSAPGSEEHRHALKDVLELKDPLLLDELGPRPALHRDAEGAFLYFRGRRFPLREAPLLLGAFYLVPCAFGMPCAETDADLAHQCVAGGGCFKDRFAKARAELAGNDLGRYRELLAAYEDLAAAIRSGDIDAFRPPP